MEQVNVQQNGLATVREAPPPPVKEDAPAKGPGRGSLTEVEGRATGGVVVSHAGAVLLQNVSIVKQVDIAGAAPSGVVSCRVFLEVDSGDNSGSSQELLVQNVGHNVGWSRCVGPVLALLRAGTYTVHAARTM